HARHHAAAGKAADVAEADADAALLRHGAEHHAGDGGDLPVAIDLAVHPFEQALLFQGLEVRAQTVERHLKLLDLLAHVAGLFSGVLVVRPRLRLPPKFAPVSTEDRAPRR